MFDYYSRFTKEEFDIHTISEISNDESIIKDFEKAGIKVHELPSRKKYV